MGARSDLPEPLSGRGLTASALQKHGIGRSRLRSALMISLGSGVYVPHELHARSNQRELHLLRAHAVAQDHPQMWLSHSTAALIHQLHLPRRISADERIHLSSSSECPKRVVRRGVMSHQRSARPEDVVERDGALVSSPARVWLELAEICTERELVMLGDQLVRNPYFRYEGRKEPHSSLDLLHEALTETRGFRGRRRALGALDQIRPGADSPAETLLRLRLVEHGLAEPELQVPARADGSGPKGDMGYPTLRIIIQYEGSTHFDADQLRSDHRRDNIFQAEGWLVLRFNAEDYRDGFRRAAETVRRAIAARRA